MPRPSGTQTRLIKVQRYPTGTSGTEDTCQQENYFYDAAYNTYNPNYSSGRLAQVQYYGGFVCSTTFTETYGYSQAGQKTNKGLTVTRNSSTVADLEATYAYDTEGRMTTIQYPGGGPNYSYGYDTMGRLNTMTSGSAQLVTGTTYDPANRLLSISGNVLSETRTYNTMGQLTNITSTAYGYPGGNINITYNYSSTQNNGKITSQTDNLSGEQVVYAYDALNRLASAVATSGSWGQSYAYDGFGNLTDQIVTAGTAPTLSVVYNASNNLQTTDCADANGNILTQSVAPYNCSNVPPGWDYTYDVANRMHPPTLYGVGTFYSYAPGNKRVWRGTVNSSQTITLDEVTFWSVTGQKLMTYSVSGLTSATYNSYFGARLISNNTGNVATDRLGSVGKFYPWGQEKPSATTNGTEKFTGYFRDAETSLDYAKNRYHQPGMGRFMSPDPYTASVGPRDPGSWNRYAYTRGDPVNRLDPSGLDDCGADFCHTHEEPGEGPPSGPSCDRDLLACYPPEEQRPGRLPGSDPGQQGSTVTSTENYYNSAKTFLESDNWAVSANCEKDLTALKVTQGDVLTLIEDANISTSADPAISSYFAQRNSAGAYPLAVTQGNTIYFMVGAYNPSTVANLPGYSPTNGSWDTDAWNLALLVHESLHTSGQYVGSNGDALMLQALGFAPGTNGGKITTTLMNDCFSGMTFSKNQ